MMIHKSKAKVSIYFPDDMLDEILTECHRQSRPVSWVIQEAWRVARAAVVRQPGPREKIGARG